MKRKLLCIYLVLVFCLTACGEETAGNGGQSTRERDMEESSVQSGAGGVSAYGDVSMAELKEAVVEALGEDYWPGMAANAKILSETYGISEDMYDDFLAEMPAVRTNVDTMIIIRAKEGQEDNVEKALNQYRDGIVNDSMQYPMNVGKVQASRIEAFDNYICFIQLGGDVTDLMDQGNDVVISHCQEHNERALDAIRTTLAE